VTVRGDDGSFCPPSLRDVPLVVPYDAEAAPAGGGGLTITGDGDGVMNLVRALLLQTAHPDSGSPRVICSGSARDIPPPARFLPNVQVSADAGNPTRRAGDTGVALIFHFGEGPVDVSGAAGVFLVRIITAHRGRPVGATGPTAAPSRVVFEGGRARACIGGTERSFLPDGVGPGTFDRVARTLARAAARVPAPTALQGCGTGRGERDVPPVSASLWSAGQSFESLSSESKERWASSEPDRPVTVLGVTGGGPLSFDLVADGPHLLVAGTTGSGKSEFLRTVVLGLALDQPPDHLTLLLIDYKGGSGLGHLAALPHCVGSLSDLSAESTGRAFVSLRAELRHRELLCAEYGARDLAHLRLLAPSSCPPRLVVVIDEFRMLCDDVPSALPDLLKIASLGRSLGVHLVLATQRAQGAVSPDLRANITSAVVLRVQTVMESQDLLGSVLAAEIPVDRPGRAFLRRGAEEPTAFQVAACSTMPPSNDSPGWQDFATYLGGSSPIEGIDGVQLRSRLTSARRPPPASGRARSVTPLGEVIEQAWEAPREPGVAGTDEERLDAVRTGAGDAERSILVEAVDALRAVRRGSPGREPRRPVLPPLPADLSPAACTAFPPACSPSPGMDSRTAACDEQDLALGIADFPDRQEQRLLHWVPGRHSHLALIGFPGSGRGAALRAIVSALPHSNRDLHLYLLDGDGSLEDLPCGPNVGAHVQPHESGRAERVLARLVDRRGREENGAPHIVLVVTGWARWTSQFRNNRTVGAEEDLQALVRDGARNGVTVLIGGERDLTTSRFFPLVPNRIYLPLGAHQDTTMTWPKLPSIDAVEGRGFAQGPITGSWGDGVCQLVLEHPVGAPPCPPSLPPFPVHALPRTVQLADLGVVPAAVPRKALPLGVHGDDLLPYDVRLPPGEVFLILGHQSSGRTNALRIVGESAGLFQRHRRILTPPCISGSPDGDTAGTRHPETAAYWRKLTAPDSLSSALEHCILLVDDADELPPDVQQILSGLVAGGAAAVLTASPAPALMSRVPLSLQARATGRGLILAPRSALDGDFFGVRLDPGDAPPPGRGYAVEPGRVVEVQLAHAGGGHSTGRATRTTGGATAFSRFPP
jgi:S-DNA-T family DNA segregation ATPase FtsK/SpoIIIE